MLQFRTFLAPACVIFIGGAVRFFRLGHGLPELVHVDAFKFVGEAARMVDAASLTPQVFQYPGLFTHILVVLFAIFEPETICGQHLLARLVVACAGTATVWLTWLLARRVCTNGASLFAAALAALCTTSVTSSRIPAPDILMVLFMIASLYFLLAERLNWKAALAAGACAGLAVGCKFTALYLGPFLVAVPFVIDRSARPRHSAALAAMAVGAAGLIFSLTTPLFWSNAATYVGRLLREAQIQRYGQIGRVQEGFFDYLVSATPTWEQPWLSTSIVGNFGWVFLVATLVAIGYCLSGRGGRRLVVIAIYVCLLVVLISGPGRIKAFRFLLPLLPALFVLLARLTEVLTFSVKIRARAWVAAACALLLLTPAALHTASYLRLTLEPTTNSIAADWIRGNIPAGRSVLLSPFFVDNLASLPISAVAIANVGSRQYGRPANVGPSPERDPIYDPAMLQELRSADVHVLVRNSYFDDAFSPVPENLRYFPVSVAEFARFEERLRSEGRLMFRVEGISQGRMGPDIEIWDF